MLVKDKYSASTRMSTSYRDSNRRVLEYYLLRNAVGVW